MSDASETPEPATARVVFMPSGGAAAAQSAY